MTGKIQGKQITWDSISTIDFDNIGGVLNLANGTKLNLDNILSTKQAGGFGAGGFGPGGFGSGGFGAGGFGGYPGGGFGGGSRKRKALRKRKHAKTSKRKSK